ncbi:Ribonuclease H protein [Gossypium australe]|uniref:Ribonuclease H protein n=1 Tax=Gossypium australe TaxID=47621 RepID=A0A5B6VCL7_9ROSI|nr:Ribonuclease H protein [Gossypium australe]
MTFRKLASSSLCPRCASGEETMNHLFRECPYGESCHIPFLHCSQIQSLLSGLPRSWLFSLWNNVEFFVLRSGPSRGTGTPVSMTKQADQVRRFYIKELDGVRKETQSISKVNMKWSNPLGHVVKINFDGASDERTKHSASGVVARDGSGHVLITSTELHEGVASAFAAKAIACR